ncbi:unnamed protein product, partial [Discosporangium mesarthrocarpum]
GGGTVGGVGPGHMRSRSNSFGMGHHRRDSGSSHYHGHHGAAAHRNATDDFLTLGFRRLGYDGVSSGRVVARRLLQEMQATSNRYVAAWRRPEDRVGTG